MTFKKAPANVFKESTKKIKGAGYQGTNAKAILLQEEMLKHKVQRRHDYWLYSGIATVSGFIGLWIGVALTNGTW